MKFEFFIAGRLKANKVEGEKTSSTPGLSIAVLGMTLAVAIMILSITVVCGFKREISDKIYGLDSHIKLAYNSADLESVEKSLAYSWLTEHELIKDVCRITEKSTILKTNEDFKGIIYKGVGSNYDWSYLENALIDGHVPHPEDSTVSNAVVLSKFIANKLKLKAGDKVLSYFIDEKVRVRNLHITGIFDTSLEGFDNNYIIGVDNVLNNIENTTEYLGINCVDYADIDKMTGEISHKFQDETGIMGISNTTRNNASYFTWLNLLDMNVIIIIVIMLIVSSFTLVSSMLMIVLERINMVGILKTLGANNNSIQRIFIYLTNKLILKSLLWGNILGLGVSLLQYHFHFIKLNAEAYYIDFVPIEINWWLIVLLNAGIVVVSYLSLLAPSHIVSTIEPTKSVKFE